VAKNVGVVRGLEEMLGKRLIVRQEPQIVSAMGAALVARDGNE
jgi:activator of 2-hydroxyglutaryl-CoA dehydratase